MKKTRIILSFLIGMLTWEVLAEEVYTGIIDFSTYSDLSWTISNEVGHTVYSSEDYWGVDSAFFFLEGEKKYRLNLHIAELSDKDTLWLQLELNGSPVLAVLPEAEMGEYSYPFYTGTTTPIMKIVGGSGVSIVDYPWQIYLSAGDYMCGGSIIAKRWILTAAHCTQDDAGKAIAASEMTVVAGATNPYSTSSSHRFGVKRYTIHSAYNSSSLRNDIAVLELDEEIDLEYADVIELISSTDVSSGATDAGVTATVTGWGLTRGTDEPTAADFPSKLQMVQLPIVSNTTAANVWSNTHTSFLFAGYENGNKDACNGDSGGPLVVDVWGVTKLAGIVSWGSGDCNTYGAFTRVSYFLDWIESQTGVTPGEILTRPQGDLEVCHGTVSSDYYTSAATSGSYQWALSPDSAGNLSVNEKNVTVTWNPNFIGFAELNVKATLDGEESQWVSSTIEVQENTILYSSPSDTTICEGDLITFMVEAEGHELTYYWYKDELFYRNSRDGTLSFTLTDPLNSGRS